MDAVYLGNNKILTKLQMGYGFIVPGDDLTASTPLILNGNYEIELTQYLINNVKNGMTCFDVGANIGYFTVLLGLLTGESGKVYSFEANKKLIPFIRENILIHYLGHRCKILEKAVYKENGRLNFKVCEKFGLNSSIYDRQDWYQEVYGDTIATIEVDAINLDTFASKIERIDFIKMDIEGGEYEAFLGMEQLIKTGKIGEIIFEWTADMLRENVNSFYNLLNEYKADYFLIKSDGTLSRFNIKEITKHMFIPNVVMKPKYFIKTK